MKNDPNTTISQLAWTAETLIKTANEFDRRDNAVQLSITDFKRLVGLSLENEQIRELFERLRVQDEMLGRPTPVNSGWHLDEEINEYLKRRNQSAKREYE